MSESMRMWIEVLFNLAYLVVIWSLVAVMWSKKDALSPESRRQANLTVAAFALLAFGDTGHVGFRVVAYAMGGLERNGALVGIGALMTAVTVTLFYLLMLELWRVRFGRRYGWFEVLLLAAAVVRLAMMVPAANLWQSIVPPQPWSTYRNIPMMVQGLGLAYLALREAVRQNDRTFLWVGVSILVSYACYTPVILFVQQLPMLGMLMIPKTMAYVAIGFLVYVDLFKPAAARQSLASSS